MVVRNRAVCAPSPSFHPSHSGITRFSDNNILTWCLNGMGNLLGVGCFGFFFASELYNGELEVKMSPVSGEP